MTRKPVSSKPEDFGILLINRDSVIKPRVYVFGFRFIASHCLVMFDLFKHFIKLQNLNK